MSYVANLTLWASVTDCDDLWNLNQIGRINGWLADEGHAPLKRIDHLLTGHKVFERSLYGGAFNYLDVGCFVEYLRTLEWEDPDQVVIVSVCEDEPFRVIPVFKGDPISLDLS